MPQVQNVTVHVTDEDGKDLEEWGVRNLRGNHASAYIRSTTDMPFKVSIRPKIPYIDVQQQLQGRRPHDKRNKRQDGAHIKEASNDDDMNEIPSCSEPKGHGCYRPDYRRRRSTEGDENQRYSLRQRYSDEHPASSPIYKHKTLCGVLAPPFSLLASLYLDGRKKPERRTVVYLNPNDEDFNYPDGEVTFKCRCVQGRDGRLKEQAWVFKDIGIETVFNKIALRDTPEDLEHPEDALVDAFNTSNLGDGHLDAAEERGKVGQIVVELKRVRLGKKYSELGHRAKHYEGDKDDVDMEEVGQEVAHKTAHKDLRTLAPRPTHCVEFEDYAEGEEPWATFQFFYRNQEQLEKFGFPGFPQASRSGKKSLRNGRALDQNLALLTPLSIANPLQKTPVSARRSKHTFEEQIKHGLRDFEKPKHEFFDYRDPPADVPSIDYGGASNEIKTSYKPIVGNDPKQRRDNNSSRSRKILSTVVAVKERRRQQALFTAGASRSGSSSPSADDPLPDPSDAHSIEPPANSPTTGFYNPLADPRLSAPKGSALDVFKTLSDASLKLAKESEATGEGQFTPKYSVKDTKYRQADHDSDADDEQDGWEDVGSTMLSDEDIGGSDKENIQEPDGDDAGLHKRLQAVFLGTKRQRGEGTEDLEEGEIQETDERQAKKVSSPSHGAGGPSIAAEVREMMGEDKRVPLSLGNVKAESPAKRIKA